MKTLESLVAEKLLKIKAVKLQPANPFTWASGWKSPIYNDNRKTLSYPVVRSFIKLELARVISEKFENVDAIAGVATGAIAQRCFSSRFIRIAIRIHPLYTKRSWIGKPYRGRIETGF